MAYGLVSVIRADQEQHLFAIREIRDCIHQKLRILVSMLQNGEMFWRTERKRVLR